MNNTKNKFEDLYNGNEDLAEQKVNDDSTTVYYDKSPGGPNGKLPNNGDPKTQVVYLQRQLDNVRSLLENKQARIYELETALKLATTFTPANQFTVSDNNEQDLFNMNHNPYWIILHSKH